MTTKTGFNRQFTSRMKRLDALLSKAKEKSSVDDRAADQFLKELSKAAEELRQQHIELTASRAKLEEDAGKYHDLFQSTTDGYLVIDKHAVILETNQTAAKLLSKAQKSLTGQSIQNFLPETDRKAFRSQLTKLTQKKFADSRLELTVRSRRGKTFPIEMIILPRNNASHMIIGFLLIIHDISKRKKVELALKESSDFNTSLIKTIPFGMDIVDMKGNVLYADASLTSATGGRVQGKKCWLIYKDDRQQCKYCPLKDARKIKIGETRAIESEDVLGGRIFEITHTGMLYHGKEAILEIFHDITTRRQVKKRLEISEANLTRAQHVAHVGSWEWSIKDNLLEWSDEMYHIFGIEKETFNGQLSDVISRSIHPDDRLKVEQSNLAVIKEKTPIPMEYRVIWPDQSVHTVWAEAGDLLVDENGNPLALTGIVQDITERKQTEEALRQRTFELRERIKELNCLYRIAELVSTPGKSLTEILQGIVNLIPPALQYPEHACARLIVEGLTFSSQGFIETPWRQTCEIILHGKSIGTLDMCYLKELPASDAGPFLKEEVILLNAITERTGRILERTRADNELRLQATVLQNIAEGIYMIGMDNGLILYANAHFESMFGYEPGEMVGKEVSIVNAPTHLSPEETKENIMDILHEKGEWRGEVMNIKKDGTIFWCYANAVLFDHPEHGKVILSIHADITERKQAAEIQRTLNAMQEADRVRSELLGNVSHELRNPLGLILFLVTALRKPELNLDDEKRSEFLQDIEHETRILQGIVDNLLDASRIQGGRLTLNPSVFDLRDVLEKTAKVNQSQMPNHHLDIHISQTKLPVKADADKIEQVLRNLLDNAAKFSPAGSTITLNAEKKEREIRVSVSDRGLGIPAPERDRIFERFYRISTPGMESALGLGLGLSISREIINEHGGQLWVEENPGGGSIFIFALPVNQIEAGYL